MDKFADEAIKSSTNSKHVYKMHDSNAYTLDVACVNTSNNNNNNEKMDDANQTATSNQIFSSAMRQDSINSDFSPLTDSTPLNGDERHRNSIEFRADDEYSINDNQSSASDEASDNNSTDNLSFVSEDIVENIIVLPNNFLSDDESTNSDDVVYAYRGADFEPNQVNANADDETDYLEMDFEPDPASEIEPEPIQSFECQSIEPSCNHMVGTTSNYIAPNLFNAISNTVKNGKTGTNALSDLNIERTGVHKNWLAPIDVRLNGIYTDGDNTSNASNRNENCHENGSAAVAIVNIHAANNNKLEVNIDSTEIESNKSLATKENANKTVTVQNGEANCSYYDNTVSLSTKKYTGTIPKTSKTHIRPTRLKTAVPDFMANGNGSARFESQATSSAHGSLEMWSTSNSQINKRWKISDREKPASSSYCDNLGGIIDASSVEANGSHVKRTPATTRSMSFPNEEHLDHEIPSAVILAFRCGPVCKREMENDIDQSVSVTFDSTYCTIDTIIGALEKIHVLPNLRALQNALRDDDESKVSRMNVSEYLVYASKRHCNYKAIIAAIEQSCDDVDVKFFYAPSDEVLETVHIPLRMIAARLPTNGSLTNILSIKNRRFHQMNVLGKIVNVIRRFPSMRDDLIHNEFITIPQYYRSGVICISKKKSTPNEI